MSNYLVWAHSNKVKHGCVLGKLTGVEKAFRLRKGIPLKDVFPSDASFSLHPDFPNNLVLTDSLINSSSLIVASPRLREHLERANTSNLEYLPVTIHDHKGKQLSRDYSILNPLAAVDCLDRDQSGAQLSDLIPGDVDEIKKLILKDGQVPPDRTLFRISGFTEVILVRRDLAEELDKNGFTGFRWVEPEKYPEI